MKKLCLFFIGSLFTVSVFSQGERGSVYLKNGTILKGKYHFDQTGKVRVESAGNLWVFDSEEIDSVAGRRVVQRAEMMNHSPYYRFFYRTEVGFLVSNPDNSQPAPLSITGSVNYLLLPRLSAGVGLGAEFLKETYLPVFLNAEYKLRNSGATPYLFLKTGYQVPLEDSRDIYYDVWPVWSSFWPGPAHNYGTLSPKGGVLVNPGIGYSFLSANGFGLSMAFGYQFHRLHYTGEKDYRLNIDYNRLTIKLGFIFN